MKQIMFIIMASTLLSISSAKGQDAIINRGVAGYHIGVVQPIFAIQQGETKYLTQSSFYAIGFPIGITFHTPGKLKFDLEFVPFVKPYLNSSRAYDVHLLFHPGVLIPLSKGFTFGLRFAFETGTGQFGLTPLLNKAFPTGKGHSFFIELVAPGRFGPQKNSGYTQIGGLHVGLGF